jgi:hypothetical protein
MTLDAVEFIRRFLLHILPLGFVKIRHFGLLSSRRRSAALALCRERLPQPATATDTSLILSEGQRSDVERRCPVCRTGKLHIRRWLSAPELPARIDHPASPSRGFFIMTSQKFSTLGRQFRRLRRRYFSCACAPAVRTPIPPGTNIGRDANSPDAFYRDHFREKPGYLRVISEQISQFNPHDQPALMIWHQLTCPRPGLA